MISTHGDRGPAPSVCLAIVVTVPFQIACSGWPAALITATYSSRACANCSQLQDCRSLHDSKALAGQRGRSSCSCLTGLCGSHPALTRRCTKTSRFFPAISTTRVSTCAKAAQSVASGWCPLVTAKLLPSWASVKGKPATHYAASHIITMYLQHNTPAFLPTGVCS